ncbi:MAG: hypothetical protein RLZZ584_2704 [Pseudomonadota bacterium]
MPHRSHETQSVEEACLNSAVLPWHVSRVPEPARILLDHAPMPADDAHSPEQDPDNRRRQLAVVFADLCGSTVRSLSMDAEDYADLLGQVRALARVIVPRHGGVVVRTQGDGIVAIFGYPASGEDDGRHAVEATLALHAAVRELDLSGIGGGVGAGGAGAGPAQQPVALHSGIHAGRVLLRPGGQEGGVFELLGPVPNIAAHLSAQAESDEVLVSELTLGPQQRHFVIGAPFVLELAVQLTPLTAVRVLGRRTALARAGDTGRTPVRTPLAGRQAELLTLARRVRAADAGAPQFVAIIGGPGMGKTRLLEEFVLGAVSDGQAVHRGYCENALSAEPLQPFLQILRALVGLTPEVAPATAAGTAASFLAALGLRAHPAGADLLHLLSLPVPAGAGGASDSAVPRPGAERLVTALCMLFDRLAGQATQLVVIDDWQWADDASRQVLDGLLALERPLLVAVATRASSASDPVAASGADIVQLAPLALDEASATIMRLLPGTHPFVAADIHRYSGGNPLFIEELCHVARQEGGGARLDHRLRPGSAWVDALIESRVARLPDAQADLVRSAAVIGNVFPCWLLERVTGVGEHDPRLRLLAEHDLIFPAEQPGMLRFKHGIARDVIYESVGRREKMALHLRIAQALAERAAEQGQDDLHEALAYHYGAAGRPQDAAPCAEQAGDKAMAASALDRARVQYRAALQALDQLGLSDRDRCERFIAIVQRLGMACVFDPLGLEDGLMLFERAVALADRLGDVALRARTEYWLAYIAYAKGEARRSIDHCRHALGLAEQAGDTRLAAQLHATLGQALAAAADYPQGLKQLQQAVAAKRGQSRGARSLPVGSAYTLATQGLVLGDLGEFRAAFACLDEALALVAGSGHQIESSVLGWFTTVLMWQGRWAEALASAARSSAIAARCKSTHLYAMHRAQQAYCEWLLGGQSDAVRALQEATAWIEARQGKLVISLNHGWLSDMLVSQGLIEPARAQAAKALRRGRALDRIGEAMACRAMARAASHQARERHAQRCIELARRAAVARSSAHEQAVNDLCAAAISARFGHLGQGRELLDRACHAFEHMAMAWHLEQARGLASAL